MTAAVPNSRDAVEGGGGRSPSRWQQRSPGAYSNGPGQVWISVLRAGIHGRPRDAGLEWDPSGAEAAASGEAETGMSTQARGEEILAVFDTAFGELLAADPAAFRVKFRKM